jgi:hypothetical protein
MKAGVNMYGKKGRKKRGNGGMALNAKAQRARRTAEE